MSVRTAVYNFLRTLLRLLGNSGEYKGSYMTSHEIFRHINNNAPPPDEVGLRSPATEAMQPTSIHSNNL